MQHQVDIFQQQQLQYETLAAVATPLQISARTLALDGGDTEGIEVTGACPGGVPTFFLVGPELTRRSFATHCALKHKFHQHHLS